MSEIKQGMKFICKDSHEYGPCALSCAADDCFMVRAISHSIEFRVDRQWLEANIDWEATEIYRRRMKALRKEFLSDVRELENKADQAREMFEEAQTCIDKNDLILEDLVIGLRELFDGLAD